MRLCATCLLLAVALLPAVSCVPRQEEPPLVDVEPEREVNTDLVFPKNVRRWSYVSSRVATDPHDAFPGYRVVLANPFLARMIEEGKEAGRGAKLAQFVYEARTDASGVAPGDLRRVNLLVQDPDRYRDTGGWGYASFDGSGKPIPVNAASDCRGCHASGPVTSLKH